MWRWATWAVMCLLLCARSGVSERGNEGEHDCSRDHAKGLRILEPEEGAVLRAGEIQLRFSPGLGASPNSRLYLLIDGRLVDFLERDRGRESISMVTKLEEPQEYLLTVVQTCAQNTSSPPKIDDELQIGEVSVRIAVLLRTKTGMERDGALLRDPKRYSVAAVACFRDETPFLAEWIEFHLCSGIEHFFLFDHLSSTKEHKRVLAPYISAGIVTLSPAIENQVDDHARIVEHSQILIFAHAVQTYGGECDWMAFIDLDEFLYAQGPIAIHYKFDGTGPAVIVDATLPLPPSSEIIEEPTLPDVLAAFREFGGVVVHWVLYGSAGHEKMPAGLIIENFLMRAADPDTLFKVVAQPSRIARVNNHNHEFIPGFFAVDEANTLVHHNTSQKHSPSANILRINHYRFKAHNHWRGNLKRRMARALFVDEDAYAANKTDQGELDRLKRYEQFLEEQEASSNARHDDSALRFLPCMRRGFASRTPPPSADEL